MNCAVTVCDTGGTILYMNDKARTTFARHGDMIGKNLFDCHSERSRGIIRAPARRRGHECLHDREKRRPQNDLPDSLARGRRRGRAGRDLDGDSRRYATLHPGLTRRQTRSGTAAMAGHPAPSIERPMTGARARCVCTDTSTRYLDPASGGRRKSSLRKSGSGTQPANGQQQAVKTKPRIPGCEQ